MNVLVICKTVLSGKGELMNFSMMKLCVNNIFPVVIFSKSESN
jgi:hypothetical protein